MDTPELVFTSPFRELATKSDPLKVVPSAQQERSGLTTTPVHTPYTETPCSSPPKLVWGKKGNVSSPYVAYPGMQDPARGIHKPSPVNR